MSAKSLTKTATSIKIKVAVLAGLIAIAGLSYTAFSIVLKPYAPSITSLTAYDPSGASRPNNQFKAGDTLTVIGGNFLQDGLFLDIVDVYWLNQNKNEIKHNVWDNASAVAPKIANDELGKTEIKNIAIDNDVVNYFSENTNDKLYLKFIFHFHKKWVGAKYNLTAESRLPLTLLVIPTSRQITVDLPAVIGKGNADLAGAVDYNDLLTLGSFLKRQKNPTQSQIIEADLNINNKIDFSDYIILTSLLDDQTGLTSSSLPIVLGNVDLSVPLTNKFTIDETDLAQLETILNDHLTNIPYKQFLSADLNGDNDLGEKDGQPSAEQRDYKTLDRLLDKSINYNNLPQDPPGEELNYSPIANAGADADITADGADKSITLDGRGSIDREGDALTYQWKILSAFYPDGAPADVLINPANLIDGVKEQANYILSKDNQNKLVKDTYVIVENQLTVTDAKGQKSTDATQIAIATPTTIPGEANNPPVASFTADPLTVAPGGKVDLDGLNSYDQDGRIVSFKWTVEPADQGSFADDRASITTYTAPAGEGTVKIKLTVTDDKGATDSAEAEAEVREASKTGLLQFLPLENPFNKIDIYKDYDYTASILVFYIKSSLSQPQPITPETTYLIERLCIKNLNQEIADIPTFNLNYGGIVYEYDILEKTANRLCIRPKGYENPNPLQIYTPAPPGGLLSLVHEGTFSIKKIGTLRLELDQSDLIIKDRNGKIISTAFVQPIQSELRFVETPPFKIDPITFDYGMIKESVSQEVIVKNNDVGEQQYCFGSERVGQPYLTGALEQCATLASGQSQKHNLWIYPEEFTGFPEQFDAGSHSFKWGVYRMVPVTYPTPSGYDVAETININVEYTYLTEDFLTLKAIREPVDYTTAYYGLHGDYFAFNGKDSVLAAPSGSYGVQGAMGKGPLKALLMSSDEPMFKEIIFISNPNDAGFGQVISNGETFAVPWYEQNPPNSMIKKITFLDSLGNKIKEVDVKGPYDEPFNYNIQRTTGNGYLVILDYQTKPNYEMSFNSQGENPYPEIGEPISEIPLFDGEIELSKETNDRDLDTLIAEKGHQAMKVLELIDYIDDQYAYSWGFPYIIGKFPNYFIISGVDRGASIFDTKKYIDVTILTELED